MRLSLFMLIISGIGCSDGQARTLTPQGQELADLAASPDLTLTSASPDLLSAVCSMGGASCPNGSFCETNDCAGASGTCKPKPQSCVGASVGDECGCDGMTYP